MRYWPIVARLNLLVSLQAAARKLQDAWQIDDWCAVWTPAAAVAAEYYAKIGHCDKEGYRKMLEIAIEDGFIELGQRNADVPKVKGRAPAIIGSGMAPVGVNLAPEKYVRATDKALVPEGEGP